MDSRSSQDCADVVWIAKGLVSLSWCVKALGFLPEELVVTGKRNVWGSPLRLLPSDQDWDKRLEDEDEVCDVDVT